MRLVFLGNNRLAYSALRWLLEGKDQLVGAVLHPPERRAYGDELERLVHSAGCEIFLAPQLGEPDVLRRIADLKPDVGVSVLFGYILRPQFLNLFPAGCVNLHPALLPYNRGAYPNVWSIVEHTPAGATLHCIDAGVDTGDIIGQRQIEVEPVDTGASLYRKSEEACLELFKELWPLLREGRAPRTPQQGQEGTSHKVRDVEQIDQIDLDRSYPARQLIDILRARTFPPHPGAYFLHQGRKVYLRLALCYEEELEQEDKE